MAKPGMKTLIKNPNSNAFMVFSMLLLGVSLTVLVVIFDFWFPSERSISTHVLAKLRSHEIPVVLATSVTCLTLLAAGFVTYVGSFVLLAIPSFVLRRFLGYGESIFMHVSDKSLAMLLPDDIIGKQDRRFRDIYLYMLLTSVDTVNSGNIRFAFTQLMFARSIGGMIVVFSAYACLILNISVLASVSIFLLVYSLTCGLYISGLGFYEQVMASGFLIDELEKMTAKDCDA